jgi:hypothetical protein
MKGSCRPLQIGLCERFCPEDLETRGIRSTWVSALGRLYAAAAVLGP